MPISSLGTHVPSQLSKNCLSGEYPKCSVASTTMRTDGSCSCVESESCLIQDTSENICVADFTVKSQSPCAVCLHSKDITAWSVIECSTTPFCMGENLIFDKFVIPKDGYCSADGCLPLPNLDGCSIDGQCLPSGTTSSGSLPSDRCMVCDPSVDPLHWTSAWPCESLRDDSIHLNIFKEKTQQSTQQVLNAWS